MAYGMASGLLLIEEVSRVAALACLHERVRHTGSQDVHMARVEDGQARGWANAHLCTLRKGFPSTVVSSRTM
jgi:hypothetical protein